MITPKYRTKKNGVPILSKKEIYAIAEDFVGDFQPAALVNPQPIDVEAFLELYLGMTPDFQYLSHNGIYLGMTVFNDTDKVPVYVPQMNCADYTGIPASRICPMFNGQKMPSLYNAYLLADVLGITLDDMIRYKPMEGEEQPCT